MSYGTLTPEGQKFVDGIVGETVGKRDSLEVTLRDIIAAWERDPRSAETHLAIQMGRQVLSTGEQ